MIKAWKKLLNVYFYFAFLMRVFSTFLLICFLNCTKTLWILCYTASEIEQKANRSANSHAPKQTFPENPSQMYIRNVLHQPKAGL